MALAVGAGSGRRRRRGRPGPSRGGRRERGCPRGSGRRPAPARLGLRAVAGPRSARSRSSVTRCGSRSSRAGRGRARRRAGGGTAPAARPRRLRRRGRGRRPSGRGVGQRPGVEEGDPAAQHGAVVAVPGAQPPAGARGVAVQLDQAGEAGAVPVARAPGRGQLQGGGGPFGGRVGESGARGPSAASPSRGRGSATRRPSGRAYGVGEDGPRLAGELRGAVCPPAGGARGGRAGSSRLAGRRPGSRGDEAEPGVARGTGRHGGSLPVDGPKTQTECHTGDGVANAPGSGSAPGARNDRVVWG